MKGKVLVTGGFGFIGSHLIKSLSALGYSIRVLSRTGSKPSWIELPEVEVAVGDLTSPDTIKGLTNGIEVIFHLASLKFARKPRDFFKVNAEGTMNLLKEVERNGKGIKRFILCSSLAAQGPSPDGRPEDEKDPPNPVSQYGKSKLQAEMVLKDRFKHIPFTIIRPPAVYGPGDIDLLPLFQMAKKGIFPLIGGRGRIAEICHVKDVVRALIMASESQKAVGETFLIGGDRPYSWEEVGDILSRILKRKVKKISLPYPITLAASCISDIAYRLGTERPFFVPRDKLREMKQRFWVCSSEKARKVLGYTPTVTLEDGIRETLIWYEKHGLL